MKTVKIGIIGFGFMGTTHWGVYKGLKNAKVVALADLDAAKRKGDISKVVGNIGGGDNSKPIDLTGVTVYDDAMKLIREADVEEALRLLRGRDDLRHFRRGAAERLLAEDVLAGLERGDCELRVVGGRHADVDHVDVLLPDELHRIIIDRDAGEVDGL